MKYQRCITKFLAINCLLIAVSLFAQNKQSEEKLLGILHSIFSHTLYDYVAELSSDYYEGLLTGTEGLNLAAEWVATKFQDWGIQPSGEDSTYFQYFPVSYTLGFEGCQFYLHIPQKNSNINKYYRYEDEFIPGLTSGSGEVAAEVVYVGYGITAPELNYDDYKGIYVRGEIVLMEHEVPVSPDKDTELFRKWGPYSFHQYKLENVAKHGAKGMLYNYGLIANPNIAYDSNFIYCYVDDSIVMDLFAGIGKFYKDVIKKISQQLKPQSFTTKKVVIIKNVTEHHSEGIGSNVIGILEGNDPELKNEVIIIGSHLDHLGRCSAIMPEANDNASGVAVALGVAEALASLPEKLKRSVIFNCFGAEEQGVVGSQYYLDHPKFPLEKTVCLINMDAVGWGDKLTALAGENFSPLWKFFQNSNEKYIHRIIKTPYFSNIARPRLYATRFLEQGIQLYLFPLMVRRLFIILQNITSLLLYLRF